MSPTLQACIFTALLAAPFVMFYAAILCLWRYIYWSNRLQDLREQRRQAVAAQLVECPECEGTGNTNIVPLCIKEFPPGNRLSDDEAKRLSEQLARCGFCDGAGKVAAERLAWLAIGEQWRQTRRELRIGMREWAERVKCLPSDYCEMESGRACPDPRFAPTPDPRAWTV